MHSSNPSPYPIHDLLRNRWSPRAFSSLPIPEDTLLRLFEAARWSPSAGNLQPWSFIVVTPRDGDLHQKLVSIMTGSNPRWAHAAPVLILAVAHVNSDRPERNIAAYYDLGQSVAHLTVQASALGLDVHQMAGFDHTEAHELFNIPEGYKPVTLIAVGYPGKAENLPDDLREREHQPRTRKPLHDFVFEKGWNQPLAMPSERATLTAEVPVVEVAGSGRG